MNFILNMLINQNFKSISKECNNRACDTPDKWNNKKIKNNHNHKLSWILIKS